MCKLWKALHRTRSPEPRPPPAAVGVDAADAAGADAAGAGGDDPPAPIAPVALLHPGGKCCG